MKYTALIMSLVLAAPAFALPESKMDTRGWGKTLEIYKKANYDRQAIQKILKNTGVPELDALWETREDIGQCLAPKFDQCLTLSRFPGANNGKPIVVLPGFTGYRKMYLEQIYDLIEQGFGPVYVSDFVGTGDSFKPYSDDGKVPSVRSHLGDKRDKGNAKEFYRRVYQVTPDAETAEKVASILVDMPLGIGWVRSFDDYQRDINFIMNFAAMENPNHKFVITSLSMGGLVLMGGLNEQSKNPTWIKNVSRILLESPMLRLRATDSALLGFVTQLGANLGAGLFGEKTLLNPDKAIPEFVDKATGTFNSETIITHSAGRIGIIDSVRVWNGAETAGATYHWTNEELKNQYATKGTDPGPHGNLNRKVDGIVKVLKNYNISLVAIASQGDPLVDPQATEKFIRELNKKGASSAHFCTMNEAKHQISQEWDWYRNPFMELLIDQGGPNAQVKATYGGPASYGELITCK